MPKSAVSRFLSVTILMVWMISEAASILAQIEPPQYRKNGLLNGMEILFLPAETERSDFVLMIKNGAAFDPLGKWGVTNLTARLVMERTQRRSGDQIREDLSLMGAQLKVGVDWDAIYYYGSSPQARLADILNILAEIVTRPNFDEESFKKVLEAMIEEVSSGDEDAEQLSQIQFQRELFGQNPYAHDARGTAEDLESLTLTDVKIQYRRLFVPNQAQLAVYFSDDEAELFRGLGRSWGGWIRGEAVPFTFRQAEPAAGARILLVDRPGPRAVFRFGNLAVEKNSADFYPLKVLEQYLILSLPGWARDVAAHSQVQAGVRLDSRKMPGSLQLSIQAPAQFLVGYLEKLREVLKALQAGQLDSERFREAKDLAVLELRDSMAQPLPRLFELLKANLHEVGLRFFSSYGVRLQRVSPGLLSGAVKRYFSPDSYLLVVVGPAVQLGPELGRLGPVDTLN